MALAVALILSLALFFGFLYLTKREARTGTRVFPKVRAELDAQMQVVERSLSRVDASALIFRFFQDAGKRVVHDLAHIALAGVEALQGILRRLVVRLRSHTPAHKGNPRAFVEYVTGVKRNLRTPREKTPPTEVE